MPAAEHGLQYEVEVIVTEVIPPVEKEAIAQGEIATLFVAS